MTPVLLVFAASLLLMASYLLTRRQARRAEARYPPAGQFLTIEGLRLHYVRQGQGPTVVLLHGSEGFWQDFKAVIPLLSPYYDVIAFDRPGHGYSDSPPERDCAPDAQAEILHRALEQMDVSNPILVAHSWSGGLALAYALAYPLDVCGLVLLGAWVYAPDAPPLWLLRIPALPLLGPLAAATLLPLVKGHYLRQSLREAFAPDAVPAVYARLARALWQRHPPQAVTFARENTADRAALRRLAPHYAEILTPTQIVTGDQDGVVPSAFHAIPLHEVLPHSELVVLPHTGHELPQTRPEAVVQAIERCRQQVCALSHLPQPVLLPAEPGTAKKEASGVEKCERKLLAARSMSMSDAAFVFGAGFDEALVAGTNALQEANSDNHAKARDLVMRYGWNAMSYQILMPGIDYWFAEEQDAVIGFVRHARVRVVAGAPVCPEARLQAVVADFEAGAQAARETVCYFGASARLQAALRNLPQPHSEVVIGAQPVWNPTEWPMILKKNSSLRAQVNRARNKHVQVEEWQAERAQGSTELQQCLAEWTASRLLPPLHFLTETVGLDRLTDRRLFVATVEGMPIGFLIATPVPNRNGWLVEQIVRGSRAPNGTAELLIDAMMQQFAGEKFTYVTLGLAPLSRRANAPSVLRPPSWLRLTLKWARAHGSRFYNFEGLDAFKAKFKPDYWEPLYAISSEARFSPRTLYAIAAAFSDGPPVLALVRALLAAGRQELAWQRERLLRK